MDGQIVSVGAQTEDEELRRRDEVDAPIEVLEWTRVTSGRGDLAPVEEDPR